MKPKLLDYLRCPCCERPFDLVALQTSDGEIDEGLLKCKTGQHLYPIVRSIPRVLANAFEQEVEFTNRYKLVIQQQRNPKTLKEPTLSFGATQKSFGYEWTTYKVQRAEEDHSYFLSKTGTDPQSLSGKLVLDAGCGSGRYSRIAGAGGATVIGVDLSMAVETAAEVTAHLPNVHIVQANIFELPFDSATFDFILSIGVLHHTPNTKRALDHLIPLLKENGEIAIWVYPRWPMPVEIYNNLLRAITTRLSLDHLHQLAVLLEPVGWLKWQLLTSKRRWVWAIGRLLSGIFLGVSHHPDREIRICDTFDWFSPPYQWHHTDVQVRAWLEGYGLTELRNLSIGQRHYQFGYGNGVNFKARKPAEPAPSAVFRHE